MLSGNKGFIIIMRRTGLVRNIIIINPLKCVNIVVPFLGTKAMLHSDQDEN